MPTMTVYIADSGTPLAQGGTSNAGHIWYSLSSDGTSQTSYGFAPISHGTSFGAGRVYDNDVDNYSNYVYQKSIFITQAQYDTLKAFGENPASQNFSTFYIVGKHDCINFVYTALGLISENLNGYQGSTWPSWNVQDKMLRDVINEMNIRNAVDPPPLPSHGDLNSVGVVTLSVDPTAAYAVLGHEFDPDRPEDVAQVADAINNGIVPASIDFGSTASRFAGSFGDTSSNKIILSSGGTDSSIVLIRDGKVTQIALKNDDGTGKETLFDPENTHPYDKLDVTTAADGKVTAAQVTLDPTVIATSGSVGQIFGSALGAALGGKDQLSNLVSSTVAGTVGSLIAQKFVQVLATSMKVDLSQVSLVDVFASQNLDIASAGIGAVSSFLTAELGTALHIGGFGGTLFNIAGSSLTFSVLSQVANSNLAFDAAIAAIDWSQAVSGAFNAASLNIDGVLGGYLAHEFVPAKTHEGAVGGELLGAIGNLILPGGLGSFIGTLLGTLIFNHFGTSPSPGAVDLLDQAGTRYGYLEYQASDRGTYDFPDKMAPAADAIINAYLGAVKGVALDHYKQVTLGYIVNPDLLFITGVPGNTNRSFTNADDAVHAAALDVLQNTEVIGGDLLLKRAHHNSNRLQLNRGTTARRRVRTGGWRLAKRASASMTCIHKSFA